MSTAPATPPVVLVTGCSSGIGRACAEAFLARGATVWATARRVDTLADLAAAGCHTLALDVTDEASMAAAVATIEDRHGAIDVLVNNAGYGQQGALEEVPLERWRAQFETNVFGVVRLCQLVLPGMRARGRGRIVMVSSMGGRLTFPGGSAYHASKYALEALSDVLRYEVARFGVQVVVVEPGLVATAYGAAAVEHLAGDEQHGPYASFTAGVRAALTNSFAGGVPGTSEPADVAAAVVHASIDPDPPTRTVVGAMAEQLIAARAAMGDRDWDQMMTTMYPQPGPSEP
jgi:NAD(P)-dependent dehydrogenase (short-subunit alcohol dehydrogenase family)